MPITSDRPPKILLVDDSEQQLELTSRVLRLFGFEVATSQGAFGVSQKVRSLVPDVVLLDVDMPGMSGDHLLTVVRRHADQGTRLVLFSACDQTRLRALANQTRADGWISKSEPPEVLATRLRALCLSK